MKKRKRRRFTGFQKLCISFFMVSLLAFMGCKFGLSSYNIRLSMQESELTDTIEKQQDKVSDLQNQINSLQEKSRVLGILDNEVTDNQNNVYVIND